MPGFGNAVRVVLFWDIICAGTKGLGLLANGVPTSSGSMGTGNSSAGLSLMRCFDAEIWIDLSVAVRQLD